MKTIDELGISPWPWNCENDMVGDANHNCVCGNGWYPDSPNALLISAAPEMYKCLREFVEAFKSLCQSMGESLAADRKHWGCIGCKDCDVTSTCKGAKWHRDMERAEKCLKQYADCNVWSAD